MKNGILVMIMGFSILAFSTAHAGGSTTVGVPNPAALNCLFLHGALEEYTTPAGVSSNCVVDEWELYLEMERRNLVTPHQYGPGAMPNPAAVNCLDIGGQLREVTTPAGTAGSCVIDEWALFKVINVTADKK